MELNVLGTAKIKNKNNSFHGIFFTIKGALCSVSHFLFPVLMAHTLLLSLR